MIQYDHSRVEKRIKQEGREEKKRGEDSRGEERIKKTEEKRRGADRISNKVGKWKHRDSSYLSLSNAILWSVIVEA